MTKIFKALQHLHAISSYCNGTDKTEAHGALGRIIDALNKTKQTIDGIPESTEIEISNLSRLVAKHYKSEKVKWVFLELNKS
tara:strand:+ start:1040 stop:1285 length:246 start_codon:yes stop_codon:yes gene_type:complete